jgi:hypothetical protein
MDMLPSSDANQTTFMGDYSLERTIMRIKESRGLSDTEFGDILGQSTDERIGMFAGDLSSLMSAVERLFSALELSELERQALGLKSGTPSIQSYLIRSGFLAVSGFGSGQESEAITPFGCRIDELARLLRSGGFAPDDFDRPAIVTLDGVLAQCVRVARMSSSCGVTPMPYISRDKNLLLNWDISKGMSEDDRYQYVVYQLLGKKKKNTITVIVDKDDPINREISRSLIGNSDEFCFPLSSLDVRVTGDLAHRKHFPHAQGLFGSTQFDYVIRVRKDRQDHSIRVRDINTHPPISLPLWLMVASEDWERNLPEMPISEAYIMWEQVDADDENSLQFGAESLQAKKNILEQQIGKRTMVLQKSCDYLKYEIHHETSYEILSKILHT